MNTASFTQTYTVRASFLNVRCGLSQPFSIELEGEANRPQMFDFDAIWDTGSECTTISRRVARLLELAPIGQVEAHHSGGSSLVNTYLVNLRLANGIEFQGLHVMDGNFNDTDILLGMDVLSYCDFAITHPNKQTKCSFQIPSVADIDFTKN